MKMTKFYKISNYYFMLHLIKKKKIYSPEYRETA